MDWRFAGTVDLRKLADSLICMVVLAVWCIIWWAWIICAACLTWKMCLDLEFLDHDGAS